MGQFGLRHKFELIGLESSTAGGSLQGAELQRLFSQRQPGTGLAGLFAMNYEDPVQAPCHRHRPLFLFSLFLVVVGMGWIDQMASGQFDKNIFEAGMASGEAGQGQLLFL
jgi:hypothetical protein